LQDLSIVAGIAIAVAVDAGDCPIEIAECYN